MNDDDRCPCLSGDTYGACCARYHRGLPDGVHAPTAEALMRSRYSAFAVGDAAYLWETWHPATRPGELDLDDDAIVWRRLDILRTEKGGPFDDTGVVEFEARYRSGDERGLLHEISDFTREAGRWYYVSGK
ncbi:YchJ family protein [Myceligenerans crystallogenes]|uniref:UPF0225 protein GCM10009751_09910 n=1 Tax=Myceligenerans crystallogenes TaxID=316335 RepID=A0ABP4ZI35_9MICO